MTTSKLTRMAFSAHSRFQKLNCGTDPRQQKKGQHGHATALLGALWRQYRVFRLLQEKGRLQRSFQRVAAALATHYANTGVEPFKTCPTCGQLIENL